MKNIKRAGFEIDLNDIYNRLNIPYFSDVYQPAEDSELFIHYFCSKEFVQDIKEFCENAEISRVLKGAELNVLDMGCGSGLLGNFFLYSVLKSIDDIDKVALNADSKENGGFKIGRINLRFIDINPSAIKSAKRFIEENKDIMALFKENLSYLPEVCYGFTIGNLFSGVENLRNNERTDGVDGSSDGADGSSDGADGISDGADGCSDGADGSSDGADEKYDFIIFNPPYLPSEPEIIDLNNDKHHLPIDYAWDGGSTDGLQTMLNFLAQVPNHLNKNGIIYFAFSNLSNLKYLIMKIEAMGFSVKQLLKIHYFFEDIILYKLKLMSFPLRSKPVESIRKITNDT